MTQCQLSHLFSFQPGPHFVPSCLRAFVPLLLLMLVVLPARAEDTSALINQQLDQPFELTLKDTPLPQALKQIGNATGVRIDPTESVYALLPWGDQTTINAKIANQSLRERAHRDHEKARADVCPEGRPRRASPGPGAARLGRRATLPELGILDTLSSTPLNFGSEKAKIPALLEAIDQKLVESKSDFAIENRLGDHFNDRVITIPRNATLSDALEAIPEQTEGTWYPWEKSIVIVPKEEQIRNQLNKTISVRWDSVDIEQVLQELSQRSGVPFSFEAGALQRVPPEFRKVRLVLQEVPIKQALETHRQRDGAGLQRDRRRRLHLERRRQFTRDARSDRGDDPAQGWIDAAPPAIESPAGCEGII